MAVHLVNRFARTTTADTAASGQRSVAVRWFRLSVGCSGLSPTRPARPSTRATPVPGRSRLLGKALRSEQGSDVAAVSLTVQRQFASVVTAGCNVHEGDFGDAVRRFIDPVLEPFGYRCLFATERHVSYLRHANANDRLTVLVDDVDSQRIIVAFSKETARTFSTFTLGHFLQLSGGQSFEDERRNLDDGGAPLAQIRWIAAELTRSAASLFDAEQMLTARVRRFLVKIGAHDDAMRECAEIARRLGDYRRMLICFTEIQSGYTDEDRRKIRTALERLKSGRSGDCG